MSFLRFGVEHNLIPMILDVGCGYRPRGAVNLDLRDLRFAGANSLKRDPRSIPNFILGDGCHLPFKDGIFDEVFSKGVIEHTPTPQLFFMEMIRSSKEFIYLICPHRFHKDWDEHITYFNLTWFETLLQRLFYSGKISRYENTLSYRGWPHPIIALIRMPFLITVKIWKKGYGFFKRMENHDPLEEKANG